MIARAVGSGWQTILADLSLILFMVTAAALANSSDGPIGNDSDAHPKAVKPAAPPPPILPVLRAEPVAVWRPAAGAPGLREWLAEVARDPRLRRTSTVHFANGGGAGAACRGQRGGRL